MLLILSRLGTATPEELNVHQELVFPTGEADAGVAQNGTKFDRQLGFAERSSHSFLPRVLPVCHSVGQTRTG